MSGIASGARIVRQPVSGFDGLVLENRYLRAVILPSLGGRVWELQDTVRGRQWIWHRESVPLAAVPVGAAYDDVWAGGWEELFPNDAPGAFEGRMLPDHGEWWARSWTAAESRREGAFLSLRLSTSCSILRASCIKEIRLADDAAELSVSYAIRSEEPRPVHFLFKQHLPVLITPDCRLALPGGRVEPVDPTFGTLLGRRGPFAWPLAPGSNGSSVDMRVVRDRSSKAREFVYVSGLPEPWCGVDDLRRRASLRMRFDSAVLPYVWLFLSYGGWRGTYTAVLEPCSNMPKDLAEAVRRRQSARLAPGEELRTTVIVTLGQTGDAAV